MGGEKHHQRIYRRKRAELYLRQKNLDLGTHKKRQGS